VGEVVRSKEKEKRRQQEGVRGPWRLKIPLGVTRRDAVKLAFSGSKNLERRDRPFKIESVGPHAGEENRLSKAKKTRLKKRQGRSPVNNWWST